MQMTSKDRLAAADALCQWFMSQEIAPLDALVILSGVSAALIYELAKGNMPHAQEGVQVYKNQMLERLQECKSSR
jgi:hypothetical protein